MTDTAPGDPAEALGPEERAFVAHPHRRLVTLSLPVMLSLVAEPVTGLVDTAFVARLGATPLAALGVGTVLLSSLLWVFNFLGVGTQTEVAHALGARDDALAREVTGTALGVAVVLGVLLALVLWPLLPPVAAFMGAEGAVQRAGVVYLEIRLLGAPALLALMVCFGTLRGLHDMRTPLVVAVGSNALNVVLDALLIFGAGPVPALGIAGAAWASVASQWTAVALALWAVHRRLGLPRHVDVARARGLLVVGRDLFLRTGMLLAFIVLGTRAATRIGTDAGAAHQAIRQTWILTALALDAFAAAAQSLIGTFLGAGHRDLARRVAGVAGRWSVGCGLALALAMLALQPLVERALVPPVALASFVTAWWIAAAAQPLNAVSFVTDGIHWGTRDYRYLRNAMALASGVGAALLLAGDATGRLTLAGVWAITGLWIALRAALGALRVWPGVGRAPLARDAGTGC